MPQVRFKEEILIPPCPPRILGTSCVHIHFPVRRESRRMMLTLDKGSALNTELRLHVPPDLLCVTGKHTGLGITH